jgi:hypothetical protein
MPSVSSEIWNLYVQCFHEQVQRLGAGGLSVDPPLTLQRCSELLSHYDMRTGSISIGLPGADEAEERLWALFLRSSLGFSSEEQLWGFVRFLVPWTITHELGHHLRCRYGRFGEDRWHEEQVANWLAGALTSSFYCAPEQAQGLEVLRRVLDTLTPIPGTAEPRPEEYAMDFSRYMRMQLECFFETIACSQLHLVELIRTHFGRELAVEPST